MNYDGVAEIEEEKKDTVFVKQRLSKTQLQERERNDSIFSERARTRLDKLN